MKSAIEVRAQIDAELAANRKLAFRIWYGIALFIAMLVGAGIAEVTR